MSHDIDIDKLVEYAKSLKNNDEQNAILDQEFRNAKLSDIKLTTTVKQKLGDAIIFSFKLFVIMQVIGFLYYSQNLINTGFSANQKSNFISVILGASFVEIVGLLVVYIKYVIGK